MLPFTAEKKKHWIEFNNAKLSQIIADNLWPLKKCQSVRLKFISYVKNGNILFEASLVTIL